MTTEELNKLMWKALHLEPHQGGTKYEHVVHDGREFINAHTWSAYFTDGFGNRYHELPNYADDLNACADFEEHVLKSHGDEYIAELKSERGQHWGFSTPIERCMAFLRVMKVVF